MFAYLHYVLTVLVRVQVELYFRVVGEGDESNSNSTCVYVESSHYIDDELENELEPRPANTTGYVDEEGEIQRTVTFCQVGNVLSAMCFTRDYN